MSLLGFLYNLYNLFINDFDPLLMNRSVPAQIWKQVE